MAYPEVTNFDQLLEVLDQYFVTPRRPPLKGEEANYLLNKMLELLRAQDGDLNNLGTTEKGSLVAAINDLMANVPSKENFDTLVGALVPHPTYNAPTATLSASSGLTGEVGTALNNLIIGLAFTRRDAGDPGNFLIRKNGATVVNSNGYTDNIVLGTSAITYQGNVSYAAGDTKNNIIGIPDPVGKVAAGNIDSNILNAIGYYATWYGPAAGQPANRADAQSLGGKQLTNGSNTFILNTGATRTLMAIITAPGKSLSSVVDLDALNAVITSEYILQGAISLADAAGNSVSGFKLYLKTMGVAYSTSHRHQITLA